MPCTRQDTRTLTDGHELAAFRRRPCPPRRARDAHHRPPLSSPYRAWPCPWERRKTRRGCGLLHSCRDGPFLCRGWCILSAEDRGSRKTLSVTPQGEGTAFSGGLRGTPPVSRLRLYFLYEPGPNFPWISDHLLFPIMLLFALSIWRLQMVNEEREREEAGREESHFA